MQTTFPNSARMPAFNKYSLQEKDFSGTVLEILSPQSILNHQAVDHSCYSMELFLYQLKED